MEKNKLPAGIRVLLAFVSVLLCLLLVVSSLAAIAIADIRIVTSRDNLKKIISQTLFSTSVPVRSVPRLAAGPTLAGAETEKGSGPLTEAVVDSLYALMEGQVSDMPVTREQVQDFVADSTLSDFLSDKIASVISDVYTGETTATLTRQEVVDLLKENEQAIEEAFSVSISDSQIGVIADWVDSQNIMGTIQAQVDSALGIDTVPQGTTSPTTPDSTAGTENGKDPALPDAQAPSSGTISINPVASALNTLRTTTSSAALLLAVAVCLLLAGALFLSNWGRPGSAMCWIAGALMGSSIPCLLATVLAAAVPSLLTGMSGWSGAVGSLVHMILMMTLPVCLGVFLLSIALLVGGCILRGRQKKKATAA